MKAVLTVAAFIIIMVNLWGSAGLFARYGVDLITGSLTVLISLGWTWWVLNVLLGPRDRP